MPTFEDIRSYYFARYGLADLLYARFDVQDPDAVSGVLRDTTPEAMADAAETRIQALLREIRVHFPDYPEPGYPAKTEVEGELVRTPDGTPKQQVADTGYFVRPHVLLDDGALNGRNGLINKPLPDKELLQRYYPPATKLSIGKKSASNVKKERLFALCCTIATLTPLKAARRSGSSDRAAVIPDLPLETLITYLDLYRDMMPSLAAPTVGYTNKDGKPYLRQNWGTFPDPPPSWSFGTLGVVTGLGSWARENGFFDDAEPVLRRLAEGRVYVIDTTGNNRTETAGTHVVRLAREGALRAALDSAFSDGPYGINSNVNDEDLQRLLRRWLLHFNRPYFHDFIAVRATYPPAFRALIDAYFMSDYDDDLIASARTAAQHINQQAYFAADGSGEARRTNKQTILASLESTLYDCESGAEMIARISVQVGRLTGQDFPAEAQAFFDATTSGDLDIKEARNLLIAYMRLRGPGGPAASDREEEGASEAAPGSEAPSAPGTASGDASARPDDQIASLG